MASSIRPDVQVSCFFCKEPITVFGRTRGRGDYHVIHHVNGNRRHNYTANLADAHHACNIRHHGPEKDWTPEARERQSKLMAVKMLGNKNKRGKTGARMSKETRSKMSEAQRLRRQREADERGW